MFDNPLKNWAGKKIGVVHHVDAGGEVAFPGLRNPVAFNQGTIMRLVPLGGSSSNPLLIGFDPTLGKILPNPGWTYCAAAMGGVQGVEPTMKPEMRLPNWGSTNSVDAYKDVVRNLEKYLVPTHRDESLDTLLSRRARIEGVAAFIVGDEIFWDRIQIFRVKNALAEMGPTETVDWIFYKFSWMPGNQLSAQEGGGHGPPDLS